MANLEHNQTTPQTAEDNIQKERELRKQHNFYTVKVDKDYMFKSLHIKKAKIADKLLEFNFFRYDIDPETSTHVHIEDNRVRKVSREEITDKFFKYVEKLEPYEHIFEKETKDMGTIEIPVRVNAKMIREALFEKLGEYFSKVLLNRLSPDREIEIKSDTKTEKFFYFQNGFIRVTKEGYELKDYKTLDKFIWFNQILNRNFNPDKGLGDFEKFFIRICGHRGKTYERISPEVQERILALKTITGYLLHGFFDTKLYAMILTDSKIGDFNEPNGRSGKTLYAKALGKVLNYDSNSKVYCEINGKDFNIKDKHRYASASMETQLININDLARNTSIEPFFNDITESVTVDKKNEKPFSILSKIIIATNMSIQVESDSARDRVKFFEFSDYFSADHSPDKEVGKWMFGSEWTETDWNQFDTFLISCCVEYFRHGIIEPKTINLHRRTLIEHTSVEFVEFMDDFFNSGKVGYMENVIGKEYPVEIELKYNEKIDKKELFLAFTQAYEDFATGKFKQRTFTSWLQKYTKHEGSLQQISKTNGLEGRSNGQDWIIFKKKYENE